MEVDYYEKRTRLYEHCLTIFTKSKKERLTSVRNAAKAVRISQTEVVEIAEDLQEEGLLMVNVGMGSLDRGISFNLPVAEWKLEPIIEPKF